MVERILIVVVLAIASVVAYRMLARRQLRRVRGAAERDALLAGFRAGVPAIVYFTTPSCTPCKTVQGPAIKTLEAELGRGLQVYQVDASNDPSAADRWGVFSVPTTFILDGNGQPREVNHGIADAAKLRRQLQAVSA